MDSFFEIPKTLYCHDSTAEELMASLLTLYEDRNQDLTAQQKWEVEGRLGTLMDITHGLSRIRLPLESEALVSLPLHLDSGLPERQFKYIYGYLCKRAGLAEPMSMVSNSPVITLQKSTQLTTYQGKSTSNKCSSQYSPDSTPLSKRPYDYISENKSPPEGIHPPSINENQVLAESGHPEQKVFKTSVNTCDENPCIPNLREWSLPIQCNTETLFFKCNDDDVLRCSYNILEGGLDHQSRTPVEVIHKEKVNRYELYMGKDTNEGEEEEYRKKILDIRVSINIETSFNPNQHSFNLAYLSRKTPHRISSSSQSQTSSSICPSSSTPAYRRIRYRQSFVHYSRMIRIDCTHVPNTHGSRGNDNYEIEVEMNPAFLLNYLSLSKNKGENIPLFSLCALFLNVLRDLTALVNRPHDTTSNKSLISSLNPQYRNLLHPNKKQATLITNSLFSQPSPTNYTQRTVPLLQTLNSHQKSLFKQYLSKTHPLIGDYLYRAVLPTIEKKFSTKETTDAQGNSQNIKDNNTDTHKEPPTNAISHTGPHYTNGNPDTSEKQPNNNTTQQTFSHSKEHPYTFNAFNFEGPYFFDYIQRKAIIQ